MPVDEEKVYFFRVSMNVYPGQSKKLYREMLLKGSSSLYEFVETITDAYRFNMDHAFTFYEGESCFDELNILYTLFYDTEDIVTEPNERSVKWTYIHDIFKKGKKMRLVYDHGREWKFRVHCLDIVEAEAGETYPKVTKKKGKAPPQYDYSDAESYHTDDPIED